LSAEAKHKALALIELLREHNILVYQAISRDKLGSQLAIAERMKIPFLLIMGKKEALDNTVMIRNLRSRQQFTIPLADLPDYIKKNISNLLN
jgi:histidyl-tRNA synthetase